MSHDKFSPSARHRWGGCAGSLREEAKYPDDDRSSPSAIDGTHSHTLLEKCIKDDALAEQYIGQTLKDDDGEFVVDAVRAERVQFALDYIDSRPGEVISEQKVDPKKLLGFDGMKGTVDVQIITDNMIELIDYKDGINPVSAVDNPQLEQYGFGVLAAHPIERFKRIRMTIVQPKLRLKGMSGIESVEMSVGEFLMKEGKIVAEVKAALDPNAPLTPGEEQCKYCKHKGNCAALSASVMKASGITFENLDVAKQAADKEPTSMTDAQIKEILEAAPLIRQMIEGVEKEALRRFEAGQPIAGLKAVRGRGTRSWAYSEEEMEEKLKKFGIPKGEIWQTKLISPAQAEKVTWTKRNGDKVQLTDRQLGILKGEYIKKSDGKLVVVSESDDREAVTIGAASMFEAVPELPSFLQVPSFLLPN